MRLWVLLSLLMSIEVRSSIYEIEGILQIDLLPGLQMLGLLLCLSHHGVPWESRSVGVSEVVELLHHVGFHAEGNYKVEKLLLSEVSVHVGIGSEEQGVPHVLIKFEISFRHEGLHVFVLDDVRLFLRVHKPKELITVVKFGFQNLLLNGPEEVHLGKEKFTENLVQIWQVCGIVLDLTGLSLLGELKVCVWKNYPQERLVIDARYKLVHSHVHQVVHI